jgi:hypothetical protein
MPAVGVPNNPGGANGWDGFGTEEPYGQKTQDSRLQQGAPLAGAKLAAGPIAAPRRAGRQTQRGTPIPAAAPVEASAVVPPPAVSPDAQLAQRWQAIAAVPGASPLVQEYAALAAQRVAGG